MKAYVVVFVSVFLAELVQALRASERLARRCYPPGVPAPLFLTHTRPESLLGTLGPLHTGAATVGLGFINLAARSRSRACCS